MCLIVFAPNIRKARLSIGVLERAFTIHNDGAGLSYLEGGEVKVCKGLFNWPDFKQAYQAIRAKVKSGPLLIHFRRATHGSKTPKNTQPIEVYPGKVVMAHNGVFSQFEPPGDISDSVYLTKLIGRLGWAYPFSNVHREIIGHYCDDNSKLVFLSNRGHYTIFNEDEGKWRRGAWYSDGCDIFDPYPSCQGPEDDDEDEDDDEAEENRILKHSGFWLTHLDKKRHKIKDTKILKRRKARTMSEEALEEWVRECELRSAAKKDKFGDGPGQQPIPTHAKWGTPLPTMHQDPDDHYNDSYWHNLL